MMAHDLSILIPARNEMFIAQTVEDILSNIEADTEVIVVLDGAWADPSIPQNDRVNVVYVPKSIGQRAATNMAAKLSKAKYVMKCDAHCAFDKGFDRKMLEAFKETGDNVTMVPIMRNLWAFDWKCYHCGWKKYQGPTPEKCDQCGKGDRLRRKMMWVGKHNPQSTSYCFDATPHFQYFEDYKHRPQYEKDKAEKGLTETMSLQGSCWMLTRERYWDLNICDESFGSWGSQGIEVACKTWLSGGRVLVNHSTWYAHMFRTQGGDFGFPYPISPRDQEKAKSFARDLFFGNKWDRQIYPLSWLVEKFWPVKGWTEEDLAELKADHFEFKGSTVAINTSEAEPTEQPQNQPQNDFLADQSSTILLSDHEAPEGLVDNSFTPDVPQINPAFYTDVSVVETRGRKKKIYKDIAIIGHGPTLKQMHKQFPKAYVCNPPKIGSMKKANQADIAFICIPTSGLPNGQLDIGLIEEAVSWCKCPLIVIRSTVNPGTGDYLAQKYHKKVVVQPEFLEDVLVIGGNPEDRRILINLYSLIYNSEIKIRQVSIYEAEVIKLSHNRAISLKIAQCQELFEACEKAGVDYYTIRDTVFGDDPRLSLGWTLPTGQEEISQDLDAWKAWAQSNITNLATNHKTSEDKPDKNEEKVAVTFADLQDKPL